MLLPLVPLIVVSLVAQPAPAQPAAAPSAAARPEARALHDAAIAAADRLSALSYNAELRATGAIAAGMPATTGRVVIAKGGSSFEQIPARFLIDAQVSDADPAAPRKVTLSFDGKTMTLLDHSARQFGRAVVNDDPLSMMAVYDPAMNLLVFNYLDKEAWGAAADIVGVTHGGQTDISGVVCDIVIVEHSLNEDGPAPAPPAAEGQNAEGRDKAAEKGPTMTVREFIGAEDHLLRRIEFPLQLPEDAGAEASVLTITLNDLKADPEVDAAEFAAAIPDGYTPRPDPEPEMGRQIGPMLKEGDPAPEWTLSDAEGKPHSLADYKGKVVLMDFWATWCGPCRAAMPGVQKLHERFKDRGVMVLGINIGEDENADPAGYMKREGFTYGLMLNAEKVAEAYGVMSIPHFFLIGTDGKIIYTSVGFDAEEGDKIAGLIEAHLKGQGK
ncbi:MAG: TlpA family protein disulfide reductase [Phycisphaerales bacterium]|nr:TlpA family protein disulfide reductase [Phycisphaerales bacterium]